MRFAFPRRSQKTQKGGLRSAHSGRLVGNPEAGPETGLGSAKATSGPLGPPWFNFPIADRIPLGWNSLLLDSSVCQGESAGRVRF